MNETEKIIVEAAKEIFQQKGFSGARMQEIADKAGVNKAMLHYYFRSKDRLFEAIFEDALDEFIPKAFELLNSDLPLKKRVEEFVTKIIDKNIENPMLSLFIVNEINRNPETIVSNILHKRKINLDKFFNDLDRQVSGKTKGSNFHIHVFVNMLSLTLYPFIGRPLINTFFNLSDKEYIQFIEQRKVEVSNLVLKNLGF